MGRLLTNVFVRRNELRSHEDSTAFQRSLSEVST